MNAADCDVGIVIVNWNTRELLRRCLASVRAASDGLRVTTCVIDNASGDGSARMVEAEFPEAILIANLQNMGYPAANNQGLRTFGFGPGSTSAPRFALLLNPDTELPPDGLRSMIRYMEDRPRCGAAGPKLVLPDGNLDLACRRSFPSPSVSFWRITGVSRLFPRTRQFGRYNMTYLDPDTETQVDSVVGAFMLVRREAMADAGLLDEAYFMYGEDLDWAFAIKRCGWEIWYNPRVTVLHVKRAASRMSSRAQIAFHESMLIFFRKHYAATTFRPLGWLILSAIHLNLARVRLRERMSPRTSSAPR